MVDDVLRYPALQCKDKAVTGQSHVLFVELIQMSLIVGMCVDFRPVGRVPQISKVHGISY